MYDGQTCQLTFIVLHLEQIIYEYLLIINLEIGTFPVTKWKTKIITV